MYQLHNFDSRHFIAEYWQKKPLLIRGALIDFNDPFDEHDLAGLAQEDEIDSRIIQQVDEKWQLHHGPFDDFEFFCQGKWSLLVQGVDQHIPKAAELMQAFDFIPHWRMDDLMVSFSVPGAGVGAHIDQYDVFIIQGKGKRHWQVGKPLTENMKCPQIDNFKPLIDVKLQPGDVLYIPPGWPHKGQSIEPSLNYSVGFRTHTDVELISHFADQLIDVNASAIRYRDPNLVSRSNPAEISATEINKLRQSMHSLIDSEQFASCIARLYSNRKEYIETCQPNPVTAQDIAKWRKMGSSFTTASGVRPCYVAPDANEPCTIFWINGIEFVVPNEEVDFICHRFAKTTWPDELLAQRQNTHFFNTLLAHLFNQGLCFTDT